MSSVSRKTGGFRKRWLLLTFLVVGSVYLYRLHSTRARKPAYPPFAFYEVKRSDLLISIVEDGALRALNETVVRSGLEGLNRIIHLAPEGAHVQKGELLVELDSSGLKDRLNEQELYYQEQLLQLQQARSNLQIQKSLAESQIKDAELKVENAESDLEKYRDADAPFLIRTVEARSSVLAEQVRIAKARNARTQELFKIGAASRSELEADSLSLKSEELALAQYAEDLRLIKKFDEPQQIRLLESKVMQAKEDLARLKQRTVNELNEVEADLKTSERSIGAIEDNVKSLKRRLENAKIFAPQEGLVVYASVSPFQGTGGGGPEGRRDEGRSRGGRGAGEFRGGRRGGRNSEGTESASTGSASTATAQSVSSANQRIASAISGSSAAQAPATSSAGGASGAGSRNSGAGGGASGSGGGGGESQSASRSFASYPSMRPSSSIQKAADNSSSGAGSGNARSVSSSSSSGQSMMAGLNPQFPPRSQNYGNFPGGEYYGTPGVLEEGLMVRQRQELIRLPDISKMLTEVKIHESRVRQVRTGMEAYIRVENIPDRHFKGTVRRVALMPDAQMSWMNPDLKVFPTDILIEDPLPSLKPGVSARAEIIITNLTQVLSVPIHTVARLQNEYVCFVKRGANVVPVPVKTGLFNDRFIEVTAGLREGDQVLLAPAGETISDDSTDTNEVQSTEIENVRNEPPPVTNEVRAEESRVRRGNAEEGEERSERPRRQRGGRRSQSEAEPE